jgi:hypothetical protein
MYQGKKAHCKVTNEEDKVINPKTVSAQKRGMPVFASPEMDHAVITLKSQAVSWESNSGNRE